MNIVAGSAIDVVTYHNDVARTGQNLNETVLTTQTSTLPPSARSAHFPWTEKLMRSRFTWANSPSPAQPITWSTSRQSMAAFIALDAETGTQLWKVSTLGAGESPSDARGCDQVTPEIGITATPVIDRARGVIYVVAMSKSGTITSSACTPWTLPPARNCSAVLGILPLHFREPETTVQRQRDLRPGPV